MTQTVWQSVLTILVIALVTFITRATPFLIFNGKKPIPKYITYLGKVLPFAIIGMIVIYCFKDVNIISGSHMLPEIIAVAIVVILHKIKHNILLSIAGGTISYMLLVQLVFL